MQKKQEQLKKQVKVIDAWFEPITNTVNWNVQTPEGDFYPLVWPRDKFGECFSISGIIPVKMLKEFCQNMIGKDFFHEIKVMPDEKTKNKIVRKPRVRKVSKSKKRTKNKPKY